MKITYVVTYQTETKLTQGRHQTTLHLAQGKLDQENTLYWVTQK